MIMNKAVILLSGGLDSVVSLASRVTEIDFQLALLFDYGQKSFHKEFVAAQNIADFYGIKLDVVKLDFLKNITSTTLVSEEDVPEVSTLQLDNSSITIDSMKSVWVPNRNGLFINIAAAYADSFNYDYIVIGANKEEANTFSDNSKDFINSINESLKTSTNYNVQVLAPLIDCTKDEIVKIALDCDAPLNLINSCYGAQTGHCGKCESCNRLKRALQNSDCDRIIMELFG